RPFPYSVDSPRFVLRSPKRSSRDSLETVRQERLTSRVYFQFSYHLLTQSEIITIDSNGLTLLVRIRKSPDDVADEVGKFQTNSAEEFGVLGLMATDENEKTSVSSKLTEAG